MKALLFMAIAGTQLPPATEPPIEAQFDAFVDLFHMALASDDATLYGAFFDDSVTWQQSNGTSEQLSRDQTLTRLRDLNVEPALLRQISRGFVMQDHTADPTFVAVHNQMQAPVLMHIEINALRVRRLPGTSSDVLCVLRQGWYSGSIDTNMPAFCDPGNGLEWLQVEVHHPDMGRVKGFVASDYLTLHEKQGPSSMTIARIGDQWRITALN